MEAILLSIAVDHDSYAVPCRWANAACCPCYSCCYLRLIAKRRGPQREPRKLQPGYVLPLRTIQAPHGPHSAAGCAGRKVEVAVQGGPFVRVGSCQEAAADLQGAKSRGDVRSTTALICSTAFR